MIESQKQQEELNKSNQDKNAEELRKIKRNMAEFKAKNSKIDENERKVKTLTNEVDSLKQMIAEMQKEVSLFLSLSQLLNLKKDKDEDEILSNTWTSEFQLL